MHEIEPFYNWRDLYTAEEDPQSPFYGRTYSEFLFSNSVYDYYIHPQWDEFGSSTLYVKILYADYELGYSILELMGEWNDCINDDIALLKREVIDVLIEEGIDKFILIGENVLNFHFGEDDYYEEWFNDLEGKGWIALVNFQSQVVEEFKAQRLNHYVHIEGPLTSMAWRPYKPDDVFSIVRKNANT